jgi:hypothetical protein
VISPRKQKHDFLLAGEVEASIVSELFGSPYYDSCINQGLVEQIQRIQIDLPLLPEDINDIITLLKYSPTALSYALDTDPLFSGHRNDVHVQIIDQFDRKHFLRTLHDALAFDFRRPELSRYFYEGRGLREIRVVTEQTIKSDTGTILTAKLPYRFNIVPLVEEMGGGYAPVLGLDDEEQSLEAPAPSAGSGS